MNNPRDLTSITQTAQYRIRIDSLLEQGLIFLQSLNGRRLDMCSTREEICVGSSLHRGYYHPSPVYDILVGNTKRGKLLKCPTSAAKYTHKYIYGTENKLEKVETVVQSSVAFIEYIQRTGNRQLGFTIDCFGNLSTVCEEIFDNNRLVAFSVLNCSFNGIEYSCYNYHFENYYYDDDGICECDFINYSPRSSMLIDEHYIFDRSDGCLTAYTNTASQAKYAIKTKRKASQPPFF